MVRATTVPPEQLISPEKAGRRRPEREPPKEHRLADQLSPGDCCRRWRIDVPGRPGGSIASATPCADVWFTVAYRQLHSTVEGVQTIEGGIDPRVLGRSLVGAPWPI
jgi:hypothetical protein